MTSTLVTVHKLGTNDITEYIGLTLEDAVIAAYAQDRGDRQSERYAERYGALVRYGARTVRCGDWAAMRMPRPRHTLARRAVTA